MTESTILHYQLTEKLGRGGMGIVWRALDSRLEREVALKFLPEDSMADPACRKRFVREAKAASALNHPNIVTIHEINSAGPELFIAMELVRGRSLAVVLAEAKRLSPQVAAGYMAQLCDGLAAAHRAGICHRDIKPSNIMLTPEGRIKILDFGLAKLHAAGGREDTGTGTIVGTAPYMSPEQVTGESAGPRSDVFSTGILFYELLTGRRPFEGSTNAEILRALFSKDPPSVASLAPEVPESLVRIVERCLQKDPEARYAHAGEIVAQLQASGYYSWTAASADQQTATLPVQRLRRPRSPWQIGGVAALAVVGFGAGIYFWNGRSSPVENARSREALQSAQANLARFDRKGNIDRAVATLEQAIPGDPANAGLLATLADAYLRKYAESPDNQWQQKALGAAQRAVAANQDLAAAHVSLGAALAAGGRNKDAAEHFEKARDLHPRSPGAHAGLAKLTTGTEAEQLLRKAIEYSPGEWIPLHELARFYYRAARYPECITAWRQALELVPDSVPVMSYLAGGLHMTGDYAGSAELFQKALTLDPGNASTWANLGTARYFQGRFEDAARAMAKATGLAPNQYLYWGNLGDSYRWAKGQEAKAPAAYSKAIQLARERLAATPNNRIRSSLAVYLAKSGESAKALAELTRLDAGGAPEKGLAFKKALIYELCRDRARALANIETAIREGYSRHEIYNEPELAALRADPAFARLSAK